MNKLTMDKPDVCWRCRTTKIVREQFMDDPDNRYGVEGQCDRCERWFTNLWSMSRKSVLDKLASI